MHSAISPTQTPSSPARGGNLPKLTWLWGPSHICTTAAKRSGPEAIRWQHHHSSGGLVAPPRKLNITFKPQRKDSRTENYKIIIIETPHNIGIGLKGIS